jgi:YfiH family protein
MLQRVTDPSGVVYYRSPVLDRAGVPHGFSTRVGGESKPPFDSLNLGNPNGCAAQDEEASIARNYDRLHAATGLSGRPRCWVHQVHGADVVWVGSADSFQNAQKADALATSDPQACLAVRAADCVPVLIATSDGRHVAAVHAGWRGVIARAVPAAVRVLVERSGTQIPLLAAIGPCISVDAFEVGDEVAAEFVNAFRDRAPIVRPTNGGKPHVDLREAIRLQLLDLGVRPDDVDATDRCTVRDASEFFSHRRDNGVTGRIAALIGPRGSSSG